MGDALEKTNYSIAEYLAIEEETGEKHEYYFGEVFAMAGGSMNHSRLAGNAYRLISNRLIESSKPCETFNSDLKIAISKERFVYPDVFVIHGKPIISDEMSESINNPKLIAEVLSEGTNDYDREGKFRAYQKLDSFQEYVLISQETVAVDVFFREPKSNFWLYRSYTLLEDVIHLKSIDVEVSVSDLYLNWEEE